MKKFNVTITEIINGRIFLNAIVKIFVPNVFDARLYSRSLIIITCVRIKNAIPNHPVTVKARTKLQNPTPITYDNTENNNTLGILPIML